MENEFSYVLTRSFSLRSDCSSMSMLLEIVSASQEQLFASLLLNCMLQFFQVDSNLLRSKQQLFAAQYYLISHLRSTHNRPNESLKYGNWITIYLTSVLTRICHQFQPPLGLILPGLVCKLTAQVMQPTWRHFAPRRPIHIYSNGQFMLFFPQT